MCTCLPISLLKFSINLSSILTILLSLFSFGLTIFGFADAAIWDTNVGDRNVILYTLLGISAGLLLMGIAGVLGAMRKNVCLLSIFSIGTIVFLAIFAGLAISAFVFPSSMFP
jgi:hypothetical protein